MALRVRKAEQTPTGRLSTAALIDLSLRNYLSLNALGSGYGVAMHLGTLVRTMFASFYLFDAGFGVTHPSIYSDADMWLGELAISRNLESGYRLGPHAVQATARLLELYESQLRTAPLDELVEAHQRAQANFQAPPERRMSMAALVQRCPPGLHEVSLDSIVTCNATRTDMF